MNEFSWQVSYNVNVEPMDRQHQKIFDYMATVHGALANKAEYNDTKEMLDKLNIYCKMHFYEEERLMEEMNYPSTLGHKRQHDRFVLDLDSFRFRFSDLQRHTQKASDDFVMIKDWFINHILSEDMRYSEFYINKH